MSSSQNKASSQILPAISYMVGILVMLLSAGGLPVTKAVAATPAITSFSPSSGSSAVETQITINGEGFGSVPGQVYIDNAGLTGYDITLFRIISWSDARIVATIPIGYPFEQLTGSGATEGRFVTIYTNDSRRITSSSRFKFTNGVAGSWRGVVQQSGGQPSWGAGEGPTEGYWHDLSNGNRLTFHRGADGSITVTTSSTPGGSSAGSGSSGSSSSVGSVPSGNSVPPDSSSSSSNSSSYYSGSTYSGPISRVVGSSSAPLASTGPAAMMWFNLAGLSAWLGWVGYRRRR